MKKLLRFNMACCFLIVIFLLAGLAFAEDAIFVDSDGNVGIGTAEPSAKLNIQGGTDETLTGGGFIITGDLSGKNIGIDNNGIMARNNGNTSSLFLQYEGGNTILNRYGGNVGIGTNYPVATLDVRGTMRQVSNAPWDIWIQGGASTSGGDSRNLAILGRDESHGDTLYINWNGEYAGGTVLSGNVGIGTSPSYALHVVENDSNIAVYGKNTQSSTSNTGVYGAATGSGSHNHGLYGHAYGAGSVNFGIYARAVNASTNYGGYFVGRVYGTGNASFASFTDRTPFYEGDALSEISRISGKDGEIDHSTLPEFAYAEHEVPVFEESELTEITNDEAFEIVMVDKVKVFETEDENGEIVKSTKKKGVEKKSKGFVIEEGKIVEVVEETPIYETELVEKKQLRKDVYLDEKTGKVYKKVGEGEIYEKDGKVFQQNQTGTKIEEQRDIGAMVSILTVAVQQLNKENERLKERLAEFEKMLGSNGQEIKKISN